jgi:hypothetical protein
MEKWYRAPQKRCPVSGKRCIPEHEVDRAVKALQTQNYARAYWCEDCDHYHLTHLPLERAVSIWERAHEETSGSDRH